jgi:hypothetical protein
VLDAAIALQQPPETAPSGCVGASSAVAMLEEDDFSLLMRLARPGSWSWLRWNAIGGANGLTLPLD